MRYFYFAMIVALVVILPVAICVVYVWLRKRWTIRKVCRSSPKEKEEKLNHALSAFGFCYDRENDAVCSGMYPWQREMGYCKAYDESAAAMYMIFDCEPIYFDYGGAHYLIELWKGQYGCTTGAEIGLYVNREDSKYKSPDKLFYDSVTDEERLPMGFVLYRSGEKVLERRELHWWLTGFQVGMYSEPSELSMEVGIAFPNASMCNAFCEGMLRAGYERKNIRVEQYRVYFRFEKAHSEQPDICGKRCRKRIQRRNYKNCRLYCRVTKPFVETLDKINYIGYCFPLLYRTIIRMGMRGNARKMRKYKRKMYH